ncbi:MAG: D-alanyl-D-alanine carboxypeptidase family protein [Phycisphaerae bacterium]
MLTVPALADIDINRLSITDANKVEILLDKFAPLIKERREKNNLASLTLNELYTPLTKSQKIFLKNFENLDANALSVKIPYLGIAAGNEELVSIRGQKIKANGKFQTLPPQFLPKDVNQSYTQMMDAMQKDLGKRLYVESGYRCSAYQLYLFIASLKNHNYSIRETSKFVALPGYSEHGCPRQQALDLVNEDGIDGQNNPQLFEALPEYAWLTKNAQNFNFALSYPKDSGNGIAFEPWHWHYSKHR